MVGKDIFLCNSHPQKLGDTKCAALAGFVIPVGGSGWNEKNAEIFSGFIDQ